MKKVLVFVVVGIVALAIALFFIGKNARISNFFDNIKGVPTHI